MPFIGRLEAWQLLPLMPAISGFTHGLLAATVLLGLIAAQIGIFVAQVVGCPIFSFWRGLMQAFGVLCSLASAVVVVYALLIGISLGIDRAAWQVALVVAGGAANILTTRAVLQAGP